MTGAAPRIAALLRRRRDEIVHRWATIERSRRPESEPSRRDELIDSLPDLLDELATHLESHTEDARFDAPTIETSIEHGLQRVEVRVPLSIVIEEYAILRRIVTRLVHEEGGEPMDGDEIEQFHALVDVAIRRAAVAHAGATAAARERLLAIVSHDLRNPLNAIMLGTQAVLAGEIPERPRRVLERVLRSSERALRMIRDLLEYATMTAGSGLSMKPTATDLVGVVHGVVEELRQAFPGRSITVHETGESIVGTWDGDRLAQALGNLVRNALQHGAASTAVDVTVTSADGSVRIAVENEGRPIDASMLRWIFEPFARGEMGARGGGSVGLGLYIAREIVRAHGGTIEALPREDGATFVVTLPG